MTSSTTFCRSVYIFSCWQIDWMLHSINCFNRISTTTPPSTHYLWSWFPFSTITTATRKTSFCQKIILSQHGWRYARWYFSPVLRLFLILEHAAQSQLHQSYLCSISGSWLEIHDDLCQRLEWNGDKTRSSVGQLHCYWRWVLLRRTERSDDFRACKDGTDV